MSALALLQTLDGLGVQVSRTAEGNLRLEPASLVPAELKAELRAQKAEVLEALSTPAEVVGQGDNLPTPTIPPDPFTVGAQPGHCASCAHWTPDGPPAFLGCCALGWVAHFPVEAWRGRAPIYTTAHHACAARAGQGWKARRSGVGA